MAKVGREAAKKLIKKLVMKRQGKAASGYHEIQGQLLDTVETMFMPEGD